MRKVILLTSIISIFGITSVTARASLVSTQEQISQITETSGSLYTSYKLDTLVKTAVYFRHDAGRIDSRYRDNATSLESISNAVNQLDSNSLSAISHIYVEGSSSPIGHPEYNRLLSLRRAQTVGKYLKTLPGLESVEIRLSGNGEGWQTFAEDVRANYHYRNRDLLLSILDDRNLTNQQKKEKIQSLEPDSRTWRLLVRDYMGSSRHSVVIVVVRKERTLQPLPFGKPIIAHAVSQEDGIRNVDSQPVIQDSIAKAEDKPVTTQEQKKVPIFSARSNLLVPLLNAGVEVPLGNRWSVAGDYYFPWIWPTQKNKNCFELLGWSVEGRYWFGRDRQPQDRLKGHSVGVYMAGGYYDFEKNYRGMQGEFVSPGVDYTYSMAVGKTKRVHLQFTLAVGYIRSWGRTYNVYGDYGALYPDDGKIIWDYVGPTKAAVSIVVPFYGKGDRR